ncbi:MAG: trehalose-6-phosphate synthase [Parcubacteria group bacterium]|nr:trehalose-6-phosphate synthase [Parcubacteria group bacterium]
MRLIVVSNRLPVTLVKKGEQYGVQKSVGGVTNGLAAYFDSRKKDYVWVGWPGMEVVKKDQSLVRQRIARKFRTHPVFLTPEHVKDFYQGFCNQILWPLFHYFPFLCIFNEVYWRRYQEVNQIYCDEIVRVAKPGDFIFVQDYQLLLLPMLLRKKLKGVTIGFFLHIPFPSFEVFRLLPPAWRVQLLNGILGADAVGFHTREYAEYFLDCTRRFLGIGHRFGKLITDGRTVAIDAFPLGIDYPAFVKSQTAAAVMQEKQKLTKVFADTVAIISIDRLDYTKGIANRLEGYELFLRTNPAYRGTVTLMVVAVPSRADIGDYQKAKRKVDERIRTINSAFGTSEWTPIIYQYAALRPAYLSALYGVGDVALVTPLRDGMNLIAKEYVASKTQGKGVLILSEFAGAAAELREAVIINPNSIPDIAQAIKQALEMPVLEQGERNRAMQKRLKRYDVDWWFGKIEQAVTRASSMLR